MKFPSSGCDNSFFIELTRLKYVIVQAGEEAEGDIFQMLFCDYNDRTDMTNIIADDIDPTLAIALQYSTHSGIFARQIKHYYYYCYRFIYIAFLL